MRKLLALALLGLLIYTATGYIALRPEKVGELLTETDRATLDGDAAWFAEHLAADARIETLGSSPDGQPRRETLSREQLIDASSKLARLAANGTLSYSANYQDIEVQRPWLPWQAATVSYRSSSVLTFGGQVSLHSSADYTLRVKRQGLGSKLLILSATLAGEPTIEVKTP